MSDVRQSQWFDPVADLNDFRDREIRIEVPFKDFPLTQGGLHAVLGGTGMGKTSLLNVLPAWLLKAPVRNGQHLVPTLIDFQQDLGDLESPKTFLLQVVKQLREGLRTLGLCTISERNFEPFFEGCTPAKGFRDALTFLLEQARQVSSAEGRPLRDVRLIGLVDDAEKIAACPWAIDLFRDLRGLYEEYGGPVRSCLNLVLTGEGQLARCFEKNVLAGYGAQVRLSPMKTETLSTWLQEASEGQLPPPLAQMIVVESGGNPFLVRYFVHEIRNRAERRGWDDLSPEAMDRLVRRFMARHQQKLKDWQRSLSQDEVAWETYHLLVQSGIAGMDTDDLEDRLWEMGVGSPDIIKQIINRLMWQGGVMPMPDKPYRLIARGIFYRYFQDHPQPEQVLPPIPIPTKFEYEYDNLELRVSAEDDHYRVHIRSQLLGTSTQESFYNPLPDAEKIAIWQNIAGHKRDAMRTRPESDSTSALEKDMVDVGARLFRAVFHGEVLACLRSAWIKARDQKMRLRVRLVLESPELHGLPWELLYDREGPFGFMALYKDTPLVRYVEQPTAVTDFKKVDKLRLLFIAASPKDHPALNLDREVKNMRDALDPLEKQGKLDYVIVKGADANVDCLHELLIKEKQGFHIIHFLGHGAFDKESGQGILLFEGKGGNAEPLTSLQVRALLRDEVSKDLRLVFLNACETAQATETSPFTSVAGSLVKAEVPAVIATQYSITDGAAVAFARGFYRALAEFYPLEAAMAEGRKAIHFLQHVKHEWGVPVLYLRARDGRIFQ